jgi:hypothetical protein
MELLTHRYAEQIAGELSCYDRILIQGTLPGFCYAAGMTAYLKTHGIRIFDYPRWAEPLRNELRQNAERLATEHGLEIEFVRKSKTFRKEARVKEILAGRGEHPGLVCILSAMEACPSYTPWHDKQTGQTYLKATEGKCLHYYFYFIEARLGLCHVRVPTWGPFRLQVSLNGHSWLASELNRRGISYTKLENAFTQIADYKAAQSLADGLAVQQLHRCLDQFALTYCPIIRQLGTSYHWSIEQAEYSTDIIFLRQRDLQALYEPLTRTAVLAVKASDVATFLGKKLHGNYQDEVGNRFDTRIQGTRIKHTIGPVSIKMYDKFGLILRIETTVNDVNFFEHYREVEHRDGTRTKQYAAMKKSIYSLAPLRSTAAAANRRYLEFLSALEDPSAGAKKLHTISQPVKENGRTYRGFNLFDAADQHLLEAVARGEYAIGGFQNSDLRARLSTKTSGQVSRLLKRLRTHGLIKKVARKYKYYLTHFGREVIGAGLPLKEMYLIPTLATSLAK